MALTNSRIAVSALDALSHAGVDFVLLHSEQTVLDGGRLSDIDLIVDRPIQCLIGVAVRALRERGLLAIAAVPYDVGAAALFLTTEDGSSSVQLDFLYDPFGRGRLGLRSERMRSGATTGKKWARIRPVDELLYLLRKRHWKRQTRELQLLASHARCVPRDELLGRIQYVLSPVAARSVVELLGSVVEGVAWRATLSYRARTLKRYAQRIIHPVGFWVHLYGVDNLDATATELSDRFRNILVCSSSCRLPNSSRRWPLWWCRNIVPVRWRPGITISYSYRWGSPPADLIVTRAPRARLTADVLVETIVRAMAHRVQARYRP